MRASEPATRSGAGPSDAVLVVSARAGEEWAREALFRRYAPMVNGLAYRLMGRDADVDDLVQESFVQGLRGLHRLHEPQAFAKWMGSIVVRTAAKILRRRRLLSRLGLRKTSAPIDVDTTVSRTASPEIAAELRRLYERLERLPVNLRTAFVLRRIEGMAVEEVASTLGVSLATAKRRVVAAEEALTGRYADARGEEG